jgi:hypothetical protein
MTSSDPSRLPSVPYDTAAVPLTNGQRRALAALLMQIARAVGRYEALLGVRLSEQMTFVQDQDTLRDEDRELLHQTLTVLVKEANALAALCRTPVQVRDVRSMLASELNILWSDVEDTRPSNLIGYGPLHPRTRQALAEPIKALAWLSLCAAEIAGSEPSDMRSAALQEALKTLDRHTDMRSQDAAESAPDSRDGSREHDKNLDTSRKSP